MNDQKKLSLVTAAGAAAALVLRLVQRLTGFEELTGLAKPGNIAAVLVALVLAAAAAGVWWLSRAWRNEDQRAFTDAFSTDSAAQLTVIVMGIFLMAVGGALQVAFSVMGGGLQSVMLQGGTVGLVWMGNISPAEVLLLGLCAVVSAVCLFPAAAACRRREEEEPRAVSGEMLLIPVVCMVVRLVLLYRINSIDPVLQAYYVELLAVVFVTLALYQLAGFAVGQGRPRTYCICSAIAMVLCAAVLADGHDISGTVFYLGCGLTVLGFRLLYRAGTEEA